VTSSDIHTLKKKIKGGGDRSMEGGFITSGKLSPPLRE
jgi:hypothetical protein